LQPEALQELIPALARVGTPATRMIGEKARGGFPLPFRPQASTDSHVKALHILHPYCTRDATLRDQGAVRLL
jgi:hypothetical protein